MHSLEPIPFLNKLAPEFHSLFTNCRDVVQIEAQFDESTHSLWSFSDQGEQRFLKLCNNDICNVSSFWRAMNLLFSFDFSKAMEYYPAVYAQLAGWSQFQVPKLFVSSSYREEAGRGYSGFLLTDYIDGRPLTAQDVSDYHVQLLASQLAALHLVDSSSAGPLFKQAGCFELTADQWRHNLKATLSALANEVTLPKVDKALILVDQLQIERFQPIMLDLRWDQFLQQRDQTMVLVDLDAYVWGPRALELVVLEYLLDDSQAEVFKSYYCQTHEIPDLTLERAVYRVLLFQMNVLGETDFDRWMAHPNRF